MSIEPNEPKKFTALEKNISTDLLIYILLVLVIVGISIIVVYSASIFVPQSNPTLTNIIFGSTNYVINRFLNWSCEFFNY